MLRAACCFSQLALLIRCLLRQECAALDTMMQERTMERVTTNHHSSETNEATVVDDSQGWVIAHQATLRALLAHFRGTAPADIPHTVVPLHTVFQMVVRFCPDSGAHTSCQLRQVYV